MERLSKDIVRLFSSQTVCRQFRSELTWLHRVVDPYTDDRTTNLGPAGPQWIQGRAPMHKYSRTIEASGGDLMALDIVAPTLSLYKTVSYAVPFGHSTARHPELTIVTHLLQTLFAYG